MEKEAAAYFQRLDADISPRALVRDLRIGDRQLVEIAKALSLDADVLILDEPTSALAEPEVARLFRVVEDLRARGVAVLYISHKMDEVFRLADRITVMRDGKKMATTERSKTTPNEVIRLMVGRDWSGVGVERRRNEGGPLLTVRGLRLPRVDALGGWQLDDIGFTLHRGEVLGVAGLLGAGRTELLESLFGAGKTKPTTGEIVVDGSPARIRSPADAVRLGIAMAPEDRKAQGLFPDLSVGANISVCHLEKLQAAGFVRWGRERRAVRESIERLGIKTTGADQSIRRLSGGNQQKCILARWLLTTPKILLLDEPTRGIDVGAKLEIYKLLRRLAAEGMGVVMTSSELPELLAVCDRILVLCEGRKTAEFDASTASEEQLLESMMASYLTAKL
jgi:ABC-type sugar transport system ATPase subunit